MAEAVIEPVRNQDQLKEFVAFPWKVYKDDLYWVPPLFHERMLFFNPKKNPFFEHSRVQLYLAKRGGEVIGTIAAIINDRHNEFQKEQVGFWGHFECVNDQDVANQLLRTAEAWVRDQGMQAIRGPMNMSTNDECGLLISGYDSPPVAMMTYNPPYYERLIESAGYVKAQDLYAYIIATNLYEENVDNLPRKFLQASRKLLQEGEITIRTANLATFEQEMVRAKEVYNAAWSHNWGFVPMTDHEIEHLARGLRPFLDPDMIFFAEDKGKPVGISVAIPDVNENLLRIKPKPGASMLRYAYDGIRFLWDRRRHQPRLFRLLIMGVVEGYRSRGIDACFYVETAKKAFAKGYKQCEMSWILESNPMMNRIIQRLGGKIYKTYRIYEKAL